MKVLPFKIPKPEQQALVYQEDHERVFYDQLHQHEEVQISYIKEGSGTLIVADTVNDYRAGDVLVIGEHVPHVFKSDPETSTQSVMYTLFFTKSSLGPEFFGLNDMNALRKFFTESEYGMKVYTGGGPLAAFFEGLKEQNQLLRVASLLNIINLLLQVERKALSSFVYQKNYTDDEGKRMNAVFEYALAHFHESFTLDVVAEKANMSKNAFCRYFKKRTNKTFFQFLIEIRIAHACKLLFRNGEHSISAISELCGFTNIANFNRKFKELKGVTPSQYRQQGE